MDINATTKMIESHLREISFDKQEIINELELLQANRLSITIEDKMRERAIDMKLNQLKRMKIYK